MALEIGKWPHPLGFGITFPYFAGQKPLSLGHCRVIIHIIEHIIMIIHHNEKCI